MFKLVLAFAMALGRPTLAEPDRVSAEARRLDTEKSPIVVKQERINRIDIDSMTMTFDGNKSVSRSGLRTGDAVRFEVMVRSETLEIIASEKQL